MEKFRYTFEILSQILGSADKLGIPSKSADGSSLSAILNVVYMIAGIIAVIVIIIAGISYVTSSGDSGKVTKAKDTILYSIVGLVVVAMAFVITNFIIGRF